MRLTCEQLDKMIPHDGPARHYAFARFVLGEDNVVAQFVAVSMKDEPLPLDSMKAIEIGWSA